MKRQWKIGLILVAEEVTIALAARAWQRWYCKPKQKTYDDEIQELVDKGYTKKAANLTLFNRMRENDPNMRPLSDSQGMTVGKEWWEPLVKGGSESLWRPAPRQPSPESEFPTLADYDEMQEENERLETYGHHPQCNEDHEWHEPCNREASPVSKTFRQIINEQAFTRLQETVDSVREEDRIDLSKMLCTNCGGPLVQISRDYVWCDVCKCDGEIHRPAHPHLGPHKITDKHTCGIEGIHWHHPTDSSVFYRPNKGEHWKIDGMCRIIVGMGGDWIDCKEHSFGEVADDGA